MNIKEVKLFNADTMEYAGSMIVNGAEWEYSGMKDEHLMSVTKGMPLKAVCSCLINFNIVYDIIEN